jgi:hypothetical protein
MWSGCGPALIKGIADSDFRARGLWGITPTATSFALNVRSAMLAAGQYIFHIYMTQLEQFYHLALVELVARQYKEKFENFSDVKPADVLPREAFNSDKEWQLWLNVVGVDIISRAHELVNVGDVKIAQPKAH